MFYDTLNQLLFAPTLFHDLHINWFAARNFRVSEVDYLRSINNQRHLMTAWSVARKIFFYDEIVVYHVKSRFAVFVRKKTGLRTFLAMMSSLAEMK